LLDICMQFGILWGQRQGQQWYHFQWIALNLLALIIEKEWLSQIWWRVYICEWNVFYVKDFRSLVSPFTSLCLDLHAQKVRLSWFHPYFLGLHAQKWYSWLVMWLLRNETVLIIHSFLISVHYSIL
jgi:hypothetical protein